MQLTKFVWPIAVMVTLSWVYNKYKGRVFDNDLEHDYALVQQYLLTEPSLARSKKPIIWIHNTYDINARSWLNFNSRSTHEMNQPYMYLTIKSIIDKCGESFNICLIDDTSFGYLLPGWAVDLQFVADPIRSKIRQLALSKILYRFGGLLVPPSFLCFQDLKPVYERTQNPHMLIAGELLDRASTSTNVELFPSAKFLAAAKECPHLNELIAYLEKQVSTDFTAESDFLGNTNRWLYSKVLKGEVALIKAEELGAKDADGKAVTIERLLGDTFVNLSGNVKGVYIPSDEILKRTKYQWFARLSAKQLLASDTLVGKYLSIQGF